MIASWAKFARASASAWAAATGKVVNDQLSGKCKWQGEVVACRVGQRHQVNHIGAVAGDLLAQRALEVTRHLSLDIEGQRNEFTALLVDRQLVVKHGFKGLKD